MPVFRAISTENTEIHDGSEYQGSAVRFYNNIQERGHYHTLRKSYKTSRTVGWVVGWKRLRFDCAVERATYLRAKPSRSPETQRPTQTSGR
jgi:hypothetical protein